MESDPHLSHNYSQEMLVKSALEYEIRNVLALDHRYDNIREIVESYMKERVKEITDRWRNA